MTAKEKPRCVQGPLTSGRSRRAPKPSEKRVEGASCVNGTVIFIALILVVACSLLGWLSALLADTHPKRDGKALKKPPISNWK